MHQPARLPALQPPSPANARLSPPLVERSLSESDAWLILRFLAAFAWADLEVTAAERAYVFAAAQALGIPPDAHEKIADWLDCPPAPEAIDPTRVPRRLRAPLKRLVWGIIICDGRVSAEEEENWALFVQLLP